MVATALQIPRESETHSATNAVEETKVRGTSPKLNLREVSWRTVGYSHSPESRKRDETSSNRGEIE
jgi:hypothetical protein